MKQEKRVAVVTGGNRGIGLEVCRQLAHKGFLTVLGSRDESLGRKAAEELKAEGLEVVSRRIDVDDGESIEKLAEYLKNDLGRLDVLVNNAGIFPDPDPFGKPEESSVFKAPPERVRQAVETNVLGPLRLCQALAPLMREGGGGRIVNVSSGMGQLSEMGDRAPAYRISKTALNALTRILANELKEAHILVNAVCPGWVRTRMGGENAERSVEQGAKSVVWAALLPDDGPSGGFFRDGKPLDW